MTSVAVPYSGPVPTGIDEVTAPWLTEALGAQVTEVRAERIALDTGFSAALYRVHLRGSADVPETLIVKLPADSLARGGMEMLGGYQRELYFYRHVAPGCSDCHTTLLTSRGCPVPTSCWCSKTCGIGRTPTTWPGCRYRVRSSVSSSWPVCTHGRPASMMRVLQEFPSMDSSLTRDLFLPAFAPGLAALPRAHRVSRCRPAVAAFAERFAELAPAALCRTFGPEHVVARRYPGRQHVLPRGCAEGGGLPVDGPRSGCGRCRVSGQPGPAHRGAARPRRCS